MSSNVATAVVPFERPTKTTSDVAPTNNPTPSNSPVGQPQNSPPPAVPQPIPEGTPQPQVPLQDTTPKTKVPEADEPSKVITELISAANEELSTTGKLSEESRQKLAEASGLPKEFVELTYEGMVARQQRTNNELLGVAGGQEAYLEMVNWATKAYAPEQATAFNSALKSGDLSKAKAAVEELKTKFAEVNGSPKALQSKAASLVTPVPSGAPAPQTTQANLNVKPYSSFSDMTEAMKDKRYGRDTEYTREVYARVNLSKF